MLVHHHLRLLLTVKMKWTLYSNGILSPSAPHGRFCISIVSHPAKLKLDVLLRSVEFPEHGFTRGALVRLQFTQPSAACLRRAPCTAAALADGELLGQCYGDRSRCAASAGNRCRRGITVVGGREPRRLVSSLPRRSGQQVAGHVHGKDYKKCKGCGEQDPRPRNTSRAPCRLSPGRDAAVGVLLSPSPEPKGVVQLPFNEVTVAGCMRSTQQRVRKRERKGNESVRIVRKGEGVPPVNARCVARWRRGTNIGRIVLSKHRTKRGNGKSGGYDRPFAFMDRPFPTLREALRTHFGVNSPLGAAR